MEKFTAWRGNYFFLGMPLKNPILHKRICIKKNITKKTTSLMRFYGQLERLDIRNVRSTLKTVAGSRLYRRFYGELFESMGLKTRGYLTSRLPDD